MTAVKANGRRREGTICDASIHLRRPSSEEDSIILYTLHTIFLCAVYHMDSIHLQSHFLITALLS
jgi:hypothetical protein